MKKTENYIRKIFICYTKHSLGFSVLLYTIMYLIVCLFTLGHTYYEHNTILAGDGILQYHPMLLDFRRNLILFIKSLFDGNPQIKMANYNFMYGTDTLTTSANIFLPFFPVFALSVFVSEESVGVIFAFAVIFISYLSGISFIFMCRHFKTDTVWNSLFAVSYVFCGNFFSDLIWNPQFIYMLFIFPVMVIGIDNIINDKNGMLFSVSVGFMAICFFYFLLYTIPFIVVYAVIKVCFKEKEKIFLKIIKYFSHGVLYTLLGLAFSAFSLFPYLYVFFNGTRSPGQIYDIFSLVIPDIDKLSETICPIFVNNTTGISPVAVPFIFLALILGNKEQRVFIVTAFLIIISPIVWFAVNAFQYDICRWGFIPSCLFSYIAASNATNLSRLTLRDTVAFMTSMVIYLVSFAVSTAWVNVILIAILLFLSVYRLRMRKLTDLYVKILKNSAEKIKRLMKKRLLKNITVIILALFTLGIITYIFALPDGPTGCVSTVMSVMIVLYFLYFSKKRISKKVLLSVFYIMLFLSEGVFLLRYTGVNSMAENICYEANKYRNISELNKKDNYFNRLSDFDKNDVYSSLNMVLKYNINSTEFFYSILDSDLIRFMERTGMDRNSFPDSNTLSGFGTKEVMYSLFGINGLYSADMKPDMYGVSKEESGSDDIMLFSNKYALPVGVSYKNVISYSDFMSFNSAELPYAMMNYVYLDDEQENIYTSVPEIASEYDVETEHNYNFRDNTNDIVSADTKISINYHDDNKAFFFAELINCKPYASTKNPLLSFGVNVDSEEIKSYRISNENFVYSWIRQSDYYTIPLGCYSDIGELYIHAPFSFENIKIYSVPLAVYIDGYNEITQETLQNVKLETNSISGNIEVSEDKVLCVNLVHSDGWSAEVDGEKVPVYKANDIFLGIKLDKGYHDVKLSYRIPWLYEGIIISLISAVGTVAVMLLKKRSIT